MAYQRGKHKINFLVIAMPYKGMATPLIWVLLPKKGNSGHQKRTALLESFFRLLPLERIKGIIGDREFIGQYWFRWLIDKGTVEIWTNDQIRTKLLKTSNSLLV